MEGFYQDDKLIDNRICYPFKSHIQECHGEGVMTEAHFHEYIEILFCLSGKINIFLDGKSYTFTVGDMIVINSMEVHYILATSEDCNKYIVIRFEPEILYTTSRTIFEAKYVLPFTMKKSTHQRLFKDEELKDTFIPHLLNEITIEDTQKKYGFELAIRTHICRIFLWILRSWNQKGLDLNIGYDFNENTIERLQKVFDYVEKNYENPISISSVAKLCNMSYSYFSRFFKTVMQKNFSEYLNYVRITEAEKLLTTTDLNITEIALTVGFSTSSYFIHQFKLYKNITPKQFRHNFNTIGLLKESSSR